MASKQKAPRQKHVPLRTCIACRKADAKRGLMRIVRDAEGRVSYDPSGKRSGRGAYVCHEPACWDQALKRGGLGRALRIDSLQPEDLVALQQMAGDVANQAVKATGLAT